MKTTKHKRLTKILFTLNMVSLLIFAVITIASTLPGFGAGGGLGLIFIAPFLWLLWGITIIADVIALPILAGWIARNPKLQKNQKIAYIGLLLACLLATTFLAHQYTAG